MTRGIRKRKAPDNEPPEQPLRRSTRQRTSTAQAKSDETTKTDVKSAATVKSKKTKVRPIKSAEPKAASTSDVKQMIPVSTAIELLEVQHAMLDFMEPLD
jgi:hypothetical protein